MTDANELLRNARNSVTVSLFDNLAYDPDQRRTVICFGSVRGGTSAVAGTLSGLGVVMGEDIPNNYEDPNFSHRGVAHMIDVISKRNAEYRLWGWKFPNAANYLDNLRNEIRNPILIIVYRDIVATLKGHIRWHSREKTQALSEIIIQQQKNTMLALRWMVPTLLVSYEKLIMHPNQGVKEISDFLGIAMPPNINDFREFLRPGEYKKNFLKD